MPIRNHGVMLNLTQDEALVLAELLTRYRLTSRLDLLHPSEYVSLLNLSTKLERSLAGPDDRDYQATLAQAQSDLVNGFEGEVPGLNYAG